MEQQHQQYPPGFKEYWYRVLNSYPPDRHEDAKEFIKQLVAHVINNGQLATYDWYTAPIPELAPVFETEDVLEDESIATDMTGDSSEDQENIKPDILTQADQHSQIISITSPFSNHSMSTLIAAAAYTEPSQMITERSIPSSSSSSSSSSSYAKRRRQRERNRSSKHDNSNNDFNFIWNPSLTTMQTEWMKE
ncbi:15605_t:CDS:2 [Rhizophagus irregularis]|nr:15605_t:CDS:2 [Rhizophagus irregularis]